VGHGYRVEVAVTVWRSDQVVRLPVAALFRRDGRWAVFRVERGRAWATPVEIGQTNGQMAEVLSGVRPGDRVVLHPGQFVSDGDRLRVRAVS
jgi:HlyD family secretion protein